MSLIWTNVGATNPFFSKHRKQNNWTSSYQMLLIWTKVDATNKLSHPKMLRMKLNILVSNVIHLYNLQCDQSTFSTTMLEEKYGHLILKFQKFVNDSMPPIFSNLLFSLINIPIYYYYITIQHCMLKKCNFIQLYNETYTQPHIKLILYNRIDYIIIIFFEKSSRHSEKWISVDSNWKYSIKLSLVGNCRGSGSFVYSLKNRYVEASLPLWVLSL